MIMDTLTKQRLMFDVNKAIIYLCKSNPNVVSSYIETLNTYFKAIGAVNNFNYDQTTMSIVFEIDSKISNTDILFNLYSISCNLFTQALIINKNLLSGFVILDGVISSDLHDAISASISILDISTDKSTFKIMLHN